MCKTATRVGPSADSCAGKSENRDRGWHGLASESGRAVEANGECCPSAPSSLFRIGFSSIDRFRSRNVSTCGCHRRPLRLPPRAPPFRGAGHQNEDGSDRRQHECAGLRDRLHVLGPHAERPFWCRDRDHFTPPARTSSCSALSKYREAALPAGVGLPCGDLGCGLPTSSGEQSTDDDRVDSRHEVPLQLRWVRRGAWILALLDTEPAEVGVLKSARNNAPTDSEAVRGG
jgi:hypothetical protein